MSDVCRFFDICKKFTSINLIVHIVQCDNGLIIYYQNMKQQANAELFLQFTKLKILVIA